MTANTTAVEYGKLVTHPNGITEIINIGHASYPQQALRFITNDDGVAVWRETTASPWRTSNEPGNDWGVLITWENGYTETHRCDNRRRADSAVALDSQNREVVTRDVVYTEWQPINMDTL